MKPLSDLIQISLSLPSALGYLASAFFLLLVFQALKTTGEAFNFAFKALSFLRGRLVRLSPVRGAVLLLLAVPVYLLRFSVIDGLQWLEQVENPAYVTADTSRALAIYEAELSRHCDPYEAEIVKRRTREIAARVGCTPLAIYEVAYSECGMDPFKVRDDGIAAGWIQFTSDGLAGIAPLSEVKAACKRRDIVRMMDWTQQYLVSRSKGIPLVDACGVYTCVFAPGYVGHPESRVLYAGFENPSYYMNSIFDGYYVDDAGRIMHSRKIQDGKITIAEMRLHLEAKKARLIASYKPKA